MSTKEEIEALSAAATAADQASVEAGLRATEAAKEADEAAAAARDAQMALDAAIRDGEPPIEPPIEPPVTGNKCTWLSGMDANQDDQPFGEFESFAAFRGGLPVKGGLTFHGSGYWGPGKSWSAMHNSAVIRRGGAIDRILSHPKGYFVTHAQPLLLADQTQKFSLLANGSLDADHRKIAQTIAATVGDRWDRFYLRLGWEANKGYPWSLEGASAAELAQYVAGYHRVALLYKEASDGKMQIVWNHLKASTIRLERYYPGDDVIDIIGTDPYDNGQSLGSGFVDDDVAWEKFIGGYNPATGDIQGIKGFRDFAKSRGKRVAYCEWGPTCQNSDFKPDGSNNSYYVTKMVEWFRSLGDLLVYENFFNGPQKHKIHPKTATQPKPSDAYKAAYSELSE